MDPANKKGVEPMLELTAEAAAEMACEAVQGVVERTVREAAEHPGWLEHELDEWGVALNVNLWCEEDPMDPLIQAREREYLEGRIQHRIESAYEQLGIESPEDWRPISAEDIRRTPAFQEQLHKTAAAPEQSAYKPFLDMETFLERTSRGEEVPL